MVLPALADVSKRYPDGTVAVDGLSLEMRSAEVTVLLRSSGSGKTTTQRRQPTPLSRIVDRDRAIALIQRRALRDRCRGSRTKNVAVVS